MKKILLALLMVAVSAAGAWGVTELDATVPANSALISTFATYERETRAKVNELINAGTSAALPGIALVSTYADFATALTTIGSTATTLIVNEDVTISTDTTVPSNVQLVCTEGNILTVASGKVLTIDGPFLCGLQQAFDGTGTVEFTNVTEVYPEWWGGLGDGTSDDSAEVRAAMLSLPAKGGKIKFSCKTWTFNLTVDQPNIWLDGCGATSNTYWATGQWQAYDTTLPIIKVQHVTSGATYYPNTGFQLTNAHLSGVNSDGVKFGQKGIHIRSAEYFNVANVNTEYFVTYQLLLGDSDLTVAHDWVYFGNFVNTTWKAHGTYTTGDTIKLLNSGSQVTSQYFVNINLYGPGSGGGYALNNVTNVRFTNGYFQIPVDGHGLYKNHSAVSGTFNLSNITVEGTSATDCVITSTHTTGNSYFSVLEGSNIDFTGSYCDGNGVVFSLADVKTVAQGPRLYDTVQGGALHFIYGGGNQTSQTDSSHSTFIRRGYDGLYWDNSMELYGTEGVMLHANPAATHPVLTIAGGASYGLSMTNTAIPLYMQVLRDDNGTTNDIWPVARLTRMNSDAYTSWGAIDGFGTYFDLRLATMDPLDHAAGEAAAGRFSWRWLDSDSASLDSALGFSIVGSGLTANTMTEILQLKEGTAKFFTPKTTLDMSVYFKKPGGAEVWANVIRHVIDDNTTGEEDTSMDFNTMAAGVSARRFGVTNRGMLSAGFTPANSSAACETGEWAWDNSTIYVCVDGGATVKWRKTSMLSW